jgi:isocitrate dehydrogenase
MDKHCFWKPMTVSYEKITPPTTGSTITFSDGKPLVPDDPIIPFIRGDGTGVDIWPATEKVIDAAIAQPTVVKGKSIGLKSMLAMKLAKSTGPINIYPKIH